MIALTIGMFDGVHKGHQHLLRYLTHLGCRTTVLTFSNHPSTILHKENIPLLSPAPIKKELLAHYGIDETIVIPFTEELSHISFQDFLAPYPIRHLVLGQDAVIGADRKGTPDALRLLGIERGFTVHFLPKLQFHGTPISSSHIRALIASGALTEAEELLGHPHEVAHKPSTIEQLCHPTSPAAL